MGRSEDPADHGGHSCIRKDLRWTGRNIGLAARASHCLESGDYLRFGSGNRLGCFGDCSRHLYSGTVGNELCDSGKPGHMDHRGCYCRNRPFGGWHCGVSRKMGSNQGSLHQCVGRYQSDPCRLGRMDQHECHSACEELLQRLVG